MLEYFGFYTTPPTARTRDEDADETSPDAPIVHPSVGRRYAERVERSGAWNASAPCGR